MAIFGPSPRSTVIAYGLRSSPKRSHRLSLTQYPRFLRSYGYKQPNIPNFAFAFDIDGVLLRSSKTTARAHRTLNYLQSHYIPFILLTNGGGTTEEKRVKDLSRMLNVQLNTSMFVQSHTPFAELAKGEGKENLKEKNVLVVGGEGDNCRQVAKSYGFTNVIIPSDIITAHNPLWPFASFGSHKPFAEPLPQNAANPNNNNHKTINRRHPKNIPALKIDAILVFNDPRDWALDTQLILDLLLSTNGHLGTLSPLNGNPTLPNRGYQQDGQPPLYFSNPDLFWASAYPLPRLGQGAFQAALEGVFDAVTGGPENGVRLQKHVFGKPTQGTFEFAEKRLQKHRLVLRGGDEDDEGLRNVYMVGDNPESDIRGANEYVSPMGSQWHSILVRTGVYSGEGKPAYEPEVIVDDVWDAVAYALEKEGRDTEGLNKKFLFYMK